MHLRYRLVNVFTQDTGKLTGNPLCVFEDATGLSDADMQALALQFNLSETTFIFPSERATHGAPAHARVRIFTPAYEMPFAGHPTLGTAHVVRALQRLNDTIVLALNVGPIAVSVEGNRFELRANRATTRAPKASRGELASALGLSDADVLDAPLWVNSGSEQLIVPLASANAVGQVRVSFDALKRATQDGPRAQAYVFAATGDETLLSRFFFHKGESVIEDPATGSATANLGGWYLARGARLPMAKTIAQGELAGRPSTLHLRIDPLGDVFVAGTVLELGSGQIEL